MWKTLKNKGLDAPLVPISYIVGGLIAAGFGLAFKQSYSGALWTVLYGLAMVLAGGIFVHTSIRGKGLIWDSILKQIQINPTDQVLDLGTGHGLVLLKFAAKLSASGHATGIDFWRQSDQSANSLQNTQAIIAEQGFSEIAEVLTADMTDLPFANQTYNFVVSSMAIHNIKPAAARKKALKEAVRVLAKNGILIIVDTGHHKHEYIAVLKSLGLKIESSKTYGIAGWWTGPWMPTYAVIAKQTAG
ncbi:class I SAM-dependent methyltransferase [Fructobacillus ficulneus]|uniref:Methyltransferase-like protein n=1 Tax=Fructobacillus ficulneus TaxID=157463 RepID=A0A0K8MGH8_9LACO|nr:class I SAM-dependent methyltransferase [Fructobacillus ficulneus]GAO99308.1 methyltransferase-like protein [Fructobacillus ficulneus]